MAEIIQYPKYLYHETEEPKIVNSVEEHEALGEDWHEEPFAAIRNAGIEELLKKYPDAAEHIEDARISGSPLQLVEAKIEAEKSTTKQKAE